MDLGRVDCIAQVVAFTVGDVGNELFAFAEFLDDEFDNVDVAHFVMPTDVIDFSDPSLADDHVDGFAVVFHIKPVADIQSFTVNRQRLVVQAVDDHQRDEFFGKMVRPVIVGTAGNSRRQAISAVICLNQQICPCLGTGIGGGSVDRCSFGKEQIRAVQRQVPVDFIGGNLVITNIAECPACVHHGCSPDDVGFQENPGIFDGAVYMAFGREIDDGVRFFFFKKLEYTVTVADIQPDKTEIRVIHDRRQRGKIPRISQFIDAHYPVIRVSFEMIVNEISADKSGSAGDEDRCHNCFVLLFPVIADQDSISLSAICYFIIESIQFRESAETGKINPCGKNKYEEI